MAGTIQPSNLAVSTTPILSNKTLPTPTLTIKPEKRLITAPRVDVEPLYTALKGAMGDVDWGVYKDAIAQFMLGNLNQEEFSRRLAPILITQHLEHLHNQFILGIYANVNRDPPEPGVASWVSANDKPSTLSSKPNAGDDSEKRLKHEVMHLGPRDRKRLKAITESPYDAFTSMISEYHDGKQVGKVDAVPASAGGFQKTNWDLEIRKRYAQPLFTETHEFPDADAIGARMQPICYEHGLSSGHTADAPTFMNLATETYIKEFLTNLMSRVSCNGPGYIRTAEFRKKADREEERIARGEMNRSAGGLLPCEEIEAKKRRALCLEDMRMASIVGDSFLGQVPIVVAGITNGRFLDTPGLEDDSASHRNSVLASSIGLVNSLRTGAPKDAPAVPELTWDMGDPMVLDEDLTTNWQGGSVQDSGDMDSMLDGCLAIGI